MSQPVSGATPVRPLSAESIDVWDYEADVVIAGYGIAGVSAAVEAARAGAEVLVLERAGGWGGAASLAGGFIYMGGGTPLQKALGFEDTPENMKTFMMAALGPGADEAKITEYCEGSVDHYNWLVDCGVPFKESFYGQPGWETPFDDGLMYSGGENSAPFNTIATPAPRGHIPQMADKKVGEKGGGYMLMKPLVETAEKLGVQAQYDMRVQTLVTDATGRVVGVQAKQYGKDVVVRARKGVVLATGSFAYNKDMVEAFAPRLIGRPGAAIEEHDGRSIRMAQALGADLAHMDATEVAFFGDPQMMVRGILVNGRGQRYVNEDTYPGRIGQLTLLQNDNQAYLIIDEDAYEEAKTTPSSTPFFRFQPKWVAETVEELEAEMGLPEGTLQATVEVYNKHAANGQDPVLGKKPEWVKPIGSPIAALDLRNFTAGFTLGGLRTNTASEVLHVSGDPIPGLFAAGRCTAGVCAWGYASGTSLGDGSFFGRRAGISAAKG
ncbi:FAD-dependent oxidoreductase [Prescottella equi]|uniref:FAD-dependent oxidoreductase n=1 Tax=Rhodococcus hoagii TaxID=43767 RepID=UPI0007CD64DC|nr:flavoprotein [Prescottella equi]MBP0081014.1 flavoprotein [Prescottella equi]MBP0086752.1 flavoprotein [Prescottella equi]MBP0090758.1 flavoprotein [Prescottella equi]MBP0096121.1 flavoprotein [Prescottella equi]